MLTFQPTVTGEGYPAILQGPGWGPSSDYLRITLAPLLTGLQVVTYDVRNTGSGPRAGGPNSQSTDRLVEDLESVRRACDLDQPVLLGHSHGAFVALGYAVRHPDALAALILLTPGLAGAGQHEPDPAVIDRLAADPRRAEALALARATPRDPRHLRTDADLARWLRRTMPLHFVDVEAMGAFGRRLVGAHPPSALALAGMPALRESWVAEGMAGIALPTLVLTADHDVATPPAEGRDVARRIAGAELVEIEEAGHNPWCERPDAVRDAILEFLRRHGIGAESD